MINIEYGGYTEKSYRRLESREKIKGMLLEGKSRLSNNISSQSSQEIRHILTDEKFRKNDISPLYLRSMTLPAQDEIITIVIPERRNIMMKTDRILSVAIGSAVIGAALAGVYGGIGMAIVGALLSYVIEDNRDQR